MKGKLITIIGIDGSGKTGLLKYLKEYYISKSNKDFEFVKAYDNPELMPELVEYGKRYNISNIESFFGKSAINSIYLYDLVQNINNNIKPLLDR